jgi:hypothetical protein
LDADELMTKAGIDWSDFKSRDYVLWESARIKAAQVICAAVEAGHNVLGAHDDPLLLQMLYDRRLDVVRAEVDPVVCARRLASREGKREAMRRIRRHKENWNRGEVARRCTLPNWIFDYEPPPRARNLDDAAHNPLFSSQHATRYDTTKGLLKLVGIRNGYVNCGDYQYLKVSPFVRLTSVVAMTSLGTTGLIEKAAELRGATFHEQLVSELRVAEQNSYANWVARLGPEVRQLIESNSIVPSSIIGTMSTPIASMAMLQYWSLQFSQFLDRYRSTGDVWVEKGYELTQLAMRRAFQRDGASLVCGC